MIDPEPVEQVNAKETQRRVCIVSSVHPASDPRIFHKQARTLANAGYDVRFVVQNAMDETVDGVRLVAVPRPSGRRQRMTRTMLGTLVRALRQRADVYHFHDPELLPAGVLLKLLTGARVIYDAHEDYPRDILTKPWLPRLLRLPVAVTFQAIEELMARYLDAVVSATDTIAARFSGVTRSVAIRNYPILELAKLYALSCQDRPNNGGYTLIYAGVLTETRGVKEMVQATSLLARRFDGAVRLKLLGRFGDAALAASIMSMPEAAHVDYLGLVPHSEVYSHLAAADIGLALLHPIPNYVESMPTKLFEYMATGLPVIASNFPLWQRLIEQEGCGLTVNPLDPTAISETIGYLLERPQLRREMGERGRRSALQKYTWESESRLLLALYEELLA